MTLIMETLKLFLAFRCVRVSGIKELDGAKCHNLLELFALPVRL